MLQEFIAPAMSFGVSAATIPGPLIAYLVNTAATQGWRRALLVVLAPLLTDAPIIVLMTFILGQLPAEALKYIQFGGGCLLLYIARSALQQYQAGVVLSQRAANNAAADNSWRRVLLTGVAMNLLSPGPWLFWATVNGPLLVKALDASPTHALAFLLAFYGVFLGGLCSWILLVHQARRLRSDLLRYIILATVLLLLWFGLGLITTATGLQQMHLPLVTVLVLGGLMWRAKDLR